MDDLYREKQWLFQVCIGHLLVLTKVGVGFTGRVHAKCAGDPGFNTQHPRKRKRDEGG